MLHAMFAVIFASMGDNCFFGRWGNFQAIGDLAKTVEGSSWFHKKTSLGFYFQSSISAF